MCKYSTSMVLVGKSGVEVMATISKSVGKPPAPVEEKAPSPLVLVCTKIETKIVQIKMIEGKDEHGNPAYNECMRNATSAYFRSDNPDPKMLPNVELVVESTEMLPFEKGKKYALELSEVE